MEHFTVHRVSMPIADYSYVTFKEVEQQILQAEIAATYDDGSGGQVEDALLTTAQQAEDGNLQESPSSSAQQDQHV